MIGRQKNIGLIFGLVLLLFLSYQFSIKNTIALKERLSLLKKEKELLTNANSKILNLQLENKYLDSILEKKELSIENSFQQTLFQKVQQFTSENNAQIISFDEPHYFEEKDTQIATYSFEVKGYFKDLLGLTNHLERIQLGKLVSVRFERKRNYRRNREELTGKYYLEKLSSIP